MNNALRLFEGAKSLAKLSRELKRESATVRLEELVGGALSSYAAAAIARVGGVHIFVSEDRDAAAYLLNDFYTLLDEECVYFFPSSYKRSVAYRSEDAQGVVQRTNTINALRGASGKGFMVVCTYPEALAEAVVEPEEMAGGMLSIGVGDKIKIVDLEDMLEGMGFVKVDFVYEPGQYSMRGGIVDVFSYAESRPFRFDFFGDEIDSIRRFEISSQLSAERIERADVIP
ncbi:MAG: transcription-repair coupling factor, partial [Alistipes sp.]|nr:transcription-repair coupling factor [Alistipes sp.]